MSDEDGFLVRTMTLTSNFAMVKERIQIDRVVSENIFRPFHRDTDVPRDKEQVISVEEDPNVKIIKKRELPVESIEEVAAHGVPEAVLQLSRQGLPNLVRYFDYLVSTESVCVVMEPLHGPELFQFLRDNAPISTRTVTRWVFQILRGLSHFHSACIIHRDVKPQNFRFGTLESDSPIVLPDRFLFHFRLRECQ